MDHKNLYEEAFGQYTSYTLLKKGELSIIGESYYKNNILYIKNDVKYPLTDNEVNSLMLKYELTKEKF